MAWIVEAAVAAADGDASASNYGARACPEIAGSKALLLTRPVGVYTCARLVSEASAQPKDALVVWPFHLKRLATGLKTLDSDPNVDARVESMQKQTTDMVQRVATLARSDGGVHGDLMVTVLWWKQSTDADALAQDMIGVHMCPMPQPKLQGATAFVYGNRRRNAVCKHSQWVTDRVPIEQRAREVEAALGTTFQEVILSSPVSDDAGGHDRLLLEGTVSNFFVVRDGSVVTAQADVLLGSTRELVLAACRDLGIPVVFEPPRLSEYATWRAAFVTSSVRLVMEIEALVWEEQGPSTPSPRQATFAREECDIPQRIRDHILAQRMYLPSEQAQFPSCAGPV